VAGETGVQPIRGELRASTFAWLSCVCLLFGLLLGIGKLLFHEWVAGAAWLALATAGGYALSRQMKKSALMG
jgi:hypothetical protein